MQDDISSSWSDVHVSSGVPLGSLLGPLLFVTFFGDLSEAVPPGSTVALYADVRKCSRIIVTGGDPELFQQDLDNLYQWSVQNFMNLALMARNAKL